MTISWKGWDSFPAGGDGALNHPQLVYMKQPVIASEPKRE